MKNSEPVIVHEIEESVFFGLAKVSYWVEDRRPDLTADEFTGKYKHFIRVRILWKQYTWSMRSQNLYDYLPGRYNLITKKDFYDKRNNGRKS